MQATASITTMPEQSIARTPDHFTKYVSLTSAEARVLPLLATHLTIGGIADRLGVRRSTANTHLTHIYNKLGVTSRARAIEQAQVHRLID